MEIKIMTRITEAEVMSMIQHAADVLAALKKENCEPTSRLMPDNDERHEYSASVKCVDNDGTDRVLVAYYYQYPEDCNEDGNYGDWEIDNYEIL